MKNFFKNFSQSILAVLTSTRFHWLLILCGIILRLKHYFENRSFWVDEAYVAATINNSYFSEIFYNFSIFADQPRLPSGFLLTEKIILSLWGDHEYALRLFPLICGILALILFYFLLKRYAEPIVISLALAIFAFSDPLIYYSAELKQYSTDLFMALILLLSVNFIQSRNHDRLSLLLVGLLGGIVLWFSNAGIFYLATLGLVLGFQYSFRLEWVKIMILGGIGLFWLLNFTVIYEMALVAMTDNERFLHMWDGLKAFPLVSVFSYQGFLWIKGALFSAFQHPVGLAFPFVIFVLFGVGCFVIFREDKRKFFLLMLPIVLTLLAAIFRKYPFAQRTLLFLAPSFIVFIAEGMGFAIKKSRGYFSFVSIILLVLVFFHPAKTAWHFLWHDRGDTENREVLQYLKDHWQEGDELFFNNQAQYAYYYYAKSLELGTRRPRGSLLLENGQKVRVDRIAKFNDALLTSGDHHSSVVFVYIYSVFNNQNDLRGLYKDGAQIFSHYQPFPLQSHSRVWFFFSHVNSKIAETKTFLLDYLNKKGKRIDAFEGEGAFVYLYSFNVPEPTASD